MDTAHLRWNIFFEDKFSKIMVAIAYFNICVMYALMHWSLTLREGRRLRVFENKVLRRIF